LAKLGWSNAALFNSMERALMLMMLMLKSALMHVSGARWLATASFFPGLSRYARRVTPYQSSHKLTVYLSG